jgi:hypothetical protein
MANQHTKGADKALTDQQEAFVSHFLKFGNATKAAEHAGYANPDIQAIRLLSKPHIKKHCQNHVAAVAMGLTPDMMNELAEIALDKENVQPKDRIAAAIAVMDRAGVANGRQGTTVNVDARQQTVNATGDAVAKLIAETFNRGQGPAALPAPAVEIIQQIEAAEDGEFTPVERDENENSA